MLSKPPVGAAAMDAATARSEPAGNGFGEQLWLWQQRMERALSARLPSPTAVPERLHAAMRYSVLGAGKRVRPALLFASARAVGLEEDQVEGAACAIELIHAYSLVHDDLPAMDDDDLRRGRPTCHRAFDEATAILVGDALQPLAFELLATDPALPGSSSVRLALIGLLAEASGSAGMAGGQALDLLAQGQRLDLAAIERLHALKTGALIRASVLMGAECQPALEGSVKAALSTFATAIGLAFQIQDDLLDLAGDAGATAAVASGAQALAKPSYPAVAGIGAARERVHALHTRANGALERLGEPAQALRCLSDWLLTRQS
jgi:farnesyl diphosphate synthase